MTTKHDSRTIETIIKGESRSFVFVALRCHKNGNILTRVTNETSGPMLLWCKKCDEEHLVILPLANFNESTYTKRDITLRPNRGPK